MFFVELQRALEGKKNFQLVNFKTKYFLLDIKSHLDFSQLSNFRD